ncbi:MAG: hypothetical protein K0A95_09535 [Chromatiales bacterium]|nr:hypothetical protein [Chromatiales bacterium]
MMNSKMHAMPRKQTGAALIVSLILLMVLTLLGVTAMNNTIMEERMAGNMRDLQIAFQSAEVGLRMGEDALRTVILPPFVVARDPDDNLVGTGGYYTVDSEVWDIDGFWFTISGDNVVATNRVLEAGDVDGAIHGPLYYVEQLPAVQSGGSLEAGTPFSVGAYRVTARGFGATENATAILQSVFIR